MPSAEAPATITHSAGSQMRCSSTRFGNAAFRRVGDSGGTFRRNSVTSLAASSSVTRSTLPSVAEISDSAAMPSRSTVPEATSAYLQTRPRVLAALSAAVLDGRRR